MAYPRCPGKEAVKRVSVCLLRSELVCVCVVCVCVCVCVCVRAIVNDCIKSFGFQAARMPVKYLHLCICVCIVNVVQSRLDEWRRNPNWRCQDALHREYRTFCSCKTKKNFAYIMLYVILISKALRLARVNEGSPRSHSFTCHPHVYPNGMSHICLCFPAT